MLRRLAQHLTDFGHDEATTVSADGIRRYFNSAIQRHHEDEDLDRFPCLLDRLKGRRQTVARSLIERLREEHDHVDALWRPLDAQLAAVQRGERASLDSGQVGALVDRHLSHSSAKESVLLELLQATLLPVDRRHICTAMASRRGLSWVQLRRGVL